MLNILSGFIAAPTSESYRRRLGGVQLKQPHVVGVNTLGRLATSTQGEAKVTARDLVEEGLGMRPTRIVSAEVRGVGALDQCAGDVHGRSTDRPELHAKRTARRLEPDRDDGVEDRHIAFSLKSLRRADSSAQSNVCRSGGAAGRQEADV
jgi:hypothetical protein